jgi:hypothetical protein
MRIGHSLQIFDAEGHCIGRVQRESNGYRGIAGGIARGIVYPTLRAAVESVRRATASATGIGALPLSRALRGEW